jgi:hypothetical protein
MDVKSSPTPSPSFLALPGQRHAHMKVTAGWSIAWERCQPGTGRSALANVEVRKLSTHVRFDAARMGGVDFDSRLAEFSGEVHAEGIKPSFDLLLCCFGGFNFNRLFELLGSVTAIDRKNLSGSERCSGGTKPDYDTGDLFRLADAAHGIP